MIGFDDAKHRTAVGKRRGRKPVIDWAKASDLWGKFSDREIAFRLGTTAPNVCAHRRSRGIEAMNPRAPNRKMPPDLGMIPDADIARREGVSRERVRQWRTNRGIAAPPRPPKQTAAGAAIVRLAVVVAELCRRSGHADLASLAEQAPFVRATSEAEVAA